jgi:hypothetical protein
MCQYQKCLFQYQQSQPQERLSHKCLCPLCRVAGVSSSVQERNVPVPKVSVPSVRWYVVVSVSAKPTTRALEPKISVPAVPLHWCLYQVCKRRMCQYQQCLFQCQQSQPQERVSQQCLCPLCRVAGVSSSVPERNVPVPKESVPSVRWQLFQCQQSQREERLSQKCLCPLCRFAGVCIKCASAKCAHCAVSVVSYVVVVVGVL